MPRRLSSPSCCSRRRWCGCGARRRLRRRARSIVEGRWRVPSRPPGHRCRRRPQAAREPCHAGSGSKRRTGRRPCHAVEMVEAPAPPVAARPRRPPARGPRPAAPGPGSSANVVPAPPETWDTTVYSRVDTEVVPPTLVRSRLPSDPPQGVASDTLPEVEIVVSPTGEVESVKLVTRAGRRRAVDDAERHQGLALQPRDTRWGARALQDAHAPDEPVTPLLDNLYVRWVAAADWAASAPRRGAGGWSAAGGAGVGPHQSIRPARLPELGRRVHLPLSGADHGGRPAVECAARAGRSLRVQLPGPGTRAGVRQLPGRLAARARGCAPPRRSRVAREPDARSALARAGVATRFAAVRRARGDLRRGAGGGVALLPVQRRVVLLAHVLRRPAAGRRVPLGARRSDARVGAAGGGLPGRLGRARALLHRRRLRRADRVLAAPAGGTTAPDRRALRARRPAVGRWCLAGTTRSSAAARGTSPRAR